MLTATCNALSFLKGHHVSGMVGGIYADDAESLSPLGGHRAGGSEEEDDDADDVLPASKKAASDTCPECGTVFQRPGHIANHRGKAACVKAQRKQVRGLRRPRWRLSHPLHLAESRTPGRWRWWRSSSATLQPAAGTAGCGADPGGLGGAP